VKRNPILDAWLVIALSAGFGSSLAAVQAALKPRIEANKLCDTLGQVPVLVTSATRAEKVVVGDRVYYRALDAAGVTVGWVVPASGQGFADKIELLIGLDATASTITGIYVLDQKETPGLGDNITTEAFRRRFLRKPADVPLSVRKGGAAAAHEIEAITGATISSESVVAIVNAALRQFAGQLRSGAIRPGGIP